MIRVLHLLGRAPDFQAERAVASLGRDLGAEFQAEARRIGRGHAYRGAAGAVLGLRGRRGDAFDVVHALDERAVAVGALSGVRRVVFSPGPSIGGGGVRWLRAVMSYRDVQVVCPTATQRRTLVEGGMPLERCHLVRPGV